MVKNQNNSTYADHAFVTLAQSDKTKDEVLEWCQKQQKLYLGIIVQEVHADEGKHFHFAVYGDINKPNFLRGLRRFVAGKHVDVKYCHEHVQNSKKVYVSWPLEDMIKYLTEPAKDKVVDTEPVCFGAEDAEELINKVAEHSDVYSVVRRMKSSGVPKDQVIEHVSKHAEDYLQYRSILDIYSAYEVKTPSLLPEGSEPRPWQISVINWVDEPLKDDDRGLWLNCPTGSGKTWILKWLFDHYSVYCPGIRPDGNYDVISMMGYDGQDFILINEVQGTVVQVEYGVEKVCWKKKFMELIKKLTDGFPIAIDFGGKHVEKLVHAKIIITSNFSLPTDGTGAIERRYMVISNTDAHGVKKALLTP